jgi:hypothetical protein
VKRDARSPYTIVQADVVDEEETVFNTMRSSQHRMAGDAFPGVAGVAEVMGWQARKCAALKITPRRPSSWNHAKLGGTY